MRSNNMALQKQCKDNYQKTAKHIYTSLLKVLLYKTEVNPVNFWLFTLDGICPIIMDFNVNRYTN